MYKKLGYMGAFLVVMYYFIQRALWRELKKLIKSIFLFLLEEENSSTEDEQ